MAGRNSRPSGRGRSQREFPDRQDNLLCVAVLLDDVIIIKTIMTFWEVSP